MDTSSPLRPSLSVPDKRRLVQVPCSARRDEFPEAIPDAMSNLRALRTSKSSRAQSASRATKRLRQEQWRLAVCCLKRQLGVYCEAVHSPGGKARGGKG